MKSDRTWVRILMLFLMVLSYDRFIVLEASIWAQGLLILCESLVRLCLWAWKRRWAQTYASVRSCQVLDKDLTFRKHFQEDDYDRASFLSISFHLWILVLNTNIRWNNNPLSTRSPGIIFKKHSMKEMSCGRLNASWKISSSAVDGQSFLVIDGSLLN